MFMTKLEGPATLFLTYSLFVLPMYGLLAKLRNDAYSALIFRPLRRFREIFAHPPNTATSLSRSFRIFFLRKLLEKVFGNDSFHRRDRFRQIFVQIGVILAIFRPFEVFCRFLEKIIPKG